ncbi:MAG: hypothetical protein RIC55_17090 [Pirellulaceae bacterium]
MKRKFTDELISAFLDGELTAEEQALVEQELMDNLEHRKMFEELRALRNSLQSMPLHKLDDQFHQRVLRRAERAMLSPQHSDSHDDSQGASASDAIAGRATPEDGDIPAETSPAKTSPADGSGAVEPLRRAESDRRPIWSVLAVVAAVLVIGLLIVFPPGGLQIADNLPSQKSDGDGPNAGQPDPLGDEQAPQPMVDGVSVEALAADARGKGEATGGGAASSETLPLERAKETMTEQAAARSLDRAESNAMSNGGANRQQSAARGRNINGNGAGDAANGRASAQLNEKQRKAAAEFGAVRESEQQSAAAQGDAYVLGDQLGGAPALSLQMARGGDAATRLEPRIVKVVMSQDAYEAGLFEQTLAAYEIAIDRLQSQEQRRGAPSASSALAKSDLAKNKDKALAENDADRDALNHARGGYEVVMVDADPILVDSMVEGLKRLPAEQVVTSDYHQPSTGAYRYVEGGAAQRRLRDLAPGLALEADERAEMPDDRLSTDPRVLNPSGGRPQPGFGGGGGGFGGGLDASEPRRDGLRQGGQDGANIAGGPESTTAGAPVAGAADFAAKRPSPEMGGQPARTMPAPASSKPFNQLNADDSRANNLADDKPIETTPTLRDEQRADSKREGDQKSAERMANQPPAAPPVVAEPSPSPEIRGAETSPSRAVAAPRSIAPIADAPIADAAAEPTVISRGAAGAVLEESARPDGNSQELLRRGRARRLNQKEVKELTDALGRLEQVNQARDAAIQSVMEKAASVVDDGRLSESKLQQSFSRMPKEYSGAKLAAEKTADAPTDDVVPGDSTPRELKELEKKRAAGDAGDGEAPSDEKDSQVVGAASKPVTKKSDTVAPVAETPSPKIPASPKPQSEDETDRLRSTAADAEESPTAANLATDFAATPLSSTPLSSTQVPRSVRVLFVIEVVPNRSSAGQQTAADAAEAEAPAVKASPPVPADDSPADASKAPDAPK